MIKQLIKDLASNTISVSVALKKSKIILAIQNDKELSKFIRNELEGYVVSSTPSYRILTGNPKGEYINKFNGRKTIIPLNFSNMTKRTGIDFNLRRVTSSIIEIESILTQSKNGTGEIQIDFTQDQLKILHDYANASDDNGWILDNARWSFSENMFQHIYSATEHKLLDILIRLNNENPDLDKQLQFMEDKEKNQSIQTTIHGNVVGSALGIGTEVTQKEITINYNQDIETLIESILKLGFERNDTIELEKLLLEKKETGAPIGKQILGWAGKMTTIAIQKGIEYKIPELMTLLSNHM